MNLTEYDTKIIQADGQVRDYPPASTTSYTLEELQRAVGGYIEVLSLPDTDFLMVVNEEGIGLLLPHNPLATQIAEEAFAGSDRRLLGPIYGNALVCKHERLR